MIIKNGRVINPSAGFDEITDMLIEDGKIKDIGIFDDILDKEVIDAKGCIVAPGFTLKWKYSI